MWTETEGLVHRAVAFIASVDPLARLHLLLRRLTLRILEMLSLVRLMLMMLVILLVLRMGRLRVMVHVLEYQLDDTIDYYRYAREDEEDEFRITY